MNIGVENQSAASDPRTVTSSVLRVGQFLPSLERALVSAYAAPRVPDGEQRAAFLAEHAQGFTVAVTSSKVGLSAELMQALPNLRAVVNCGVGYDTIDVGLARERGIVISNTPDVLNDCVADTAVALFLDVLRRTSAADRFVRRGAWLAGRFPLTVKASGRRVGIVGLGRIGTVIARRLEGFDSEISYHNRKPVDGVSYRYVADLRQLAEESDVLIIAAAGGPESAGLISAETLRALGSSGFLINIARGSIIDEPALVDALVNGVIAGAGLDAFVDEPRVPEALLALENVVLSPHLASGTRETREAMAELALANLSNFMTHGTLLTAVQ